MKILACIVLGYLLGTISPSALISKLRKTDLRKSGTKNLGATNTFLNFGKGMGAIVLVTDIAKSFAAYKLAQLIFPGFALAGMISGCAAVAGHIFPFYMGFKGGKGLASFGGLILAHDAPLFLFMLIVCFGLMLILNYSFALPFSAAAMFPVLAGIRSQSLLVGMLALASSLLIIFSHRADIVLVFQGKAEHTEVRRFFARKADKE